MQKRNRIYLVTAELNLPWVTWELNPVSLVQVIHVIRVIQRPASARHDEAKQSPYESYW